MSLTVSCFYSSLRGLSEWLQDHHKRSRGWGRAAGVCTGKGVLEVAVKVGLKAQVGVCLVPGGGGLLLFQQRTWAGVEGLES